MFGFKRKSEEVRHEISKWQKIDKAMCMCVILLGPMLAVCYSYYSTIWAVVFFILTPVAVFGKHLYYTDTPTHKSLKIIAAILRSIIYSAIITASIIPFTMNNQQKWYYPVQRAVYLSNYSEGSVLETLLPEKLPEKADNYSVRFTPKVLQGSAAVDITFCTDADTVAGYRSKALSYGAEQVPMTIENDYGETETNPKAERWLNIINADGADPDNAEIYVLKQFYENTAAYILNEKTGYVRIYY